MWRIGRRALSVPPAVWTRLSEVERRHVELCEAIERGTVLGAKEARELSVHEDVLEAKRLLLRTRQEVSDLEELARDDAELRAEAERELAVVAPRVADLEAALVSKLAPRDETEGASALLEIRASAGGDEATAFAQQLLGMYERYAASKSWRWELLDEAKSEYGGTKEAFARVADGFSLLQFESGVHRVQRVPSNDTKIQTSTVTVIVLPQDDDDDDARELPAADIKIDVFRASGAGGQHVNTTNSAVRATHVPTGIVVAIQDERSQHQNRDKALRVLAARVAAQKAAQKHQDRSQRRAAIAGSGDRSERIRTYNVPHDRVVDHRLNYTAHSVDRVLSADLLDDFLVRLYERDKALRLAAFLAAPTNGDAR